MQELPNTNLDLKDRKILLALFGKHRRFHTELSKEIGISKEVLSYRLKRLERDGILTRLIPIIDFAALGHQLFRLQINFNAIPEEQKTQFIETAKKIPNVGWLVLLSGTWDLVITFHVRDHQEFERTYRELMDTHGHLFEDTLLTIVTQIHYYPPTYLTPTHRTRITTGTGKPHNPLDPTARRVLLALLEDAQQPLTQIATKLGCSITTVKYHLQLLEAQGIIVGYKPLIDITKIGYDHFKILLELGNPSQRSTIKTLLDTNDNVVYITESLGRYDLEFEAEYPKTQDLLALIERIKTLANVKNIEIIFNNKELVINEVAP